MRELTIQVVGHADRTPISARDRARFPDNYALSAARAQAVADYLRATLPDARIEVEGRGADEPLAAGTAPDSLARNRRVEIEVAGVRTQPSQEWRIVTASAQSAIVPTTGAIGGEPAVPQRALASARPAGVSGRPRARDRHRDARAAARDLATERRLRAAGADDPRRRRALARPAGAAHASTADPSAS